MRAFSATSQTYTHMDLCADSLRAKHISIPPNMQTLLRTLRIGFVRPNDAVRYEKLQKSSFHTVQVVTMHSRHPASPKPPVRYR